jgi:antitoxin HigA-1
MAEFASPAPPLESIPPGIHPGQVVRQALRRARLTQEKAAVLLRMPRRGLNAIVAEHRRITAESAIAFGALFQTGPEYWLTLQARYDVYRAKLRPKRTPPPPPLK